MSPSLFIFEVELENNLKPLFFYCFSFVMIALIVTNGSVDTCMFDDVCTINVVT